MEDQNLFLKGFISPTKPVKKSLDKEINTYKMNLQTSEDSGFSLDIEEQNSNHQHTALTARDNRKSLKSPGQGQDNNSLNAFNFPSDIHFHQKLQRAVSINENAQMKSESTNFSIKLQTLISSQKDTQAQPSQLTVPQRKPLINASFSAYSHQAELFKYVALVIWKGSEIPKLSINTQIPNYYMIKKLHHSLKIYLDQLKSRSNIYFLGEEDFAELLGLELYNQLIADI